MKMVQPVLSEEYKKRLKDNPDITVLSLYLPQMERGVALELKPADIQLMDEDAPAFCQQFLYPCLAQLSEEIAQMKHNKNG